MSSNQESLTLSPFMAIFDMVVPKDNMLCQINELVIIQNSSISRPIQMHEWTIKQRTPIRKKKATFRSISNEMSPFQI
ncbi:MAG TPA: hypothetical protein VI423_01910 [Paenisporosarcina sp.]|nr:hypothetical protein [Paenisporosarcina sp.]